ncbi:MAG TPA: hypothetical protein VMD49_08780 [Steroidobacteraceae bacterium]|nr:hypothetical protein [Steroidobacteraceae bacterium]
MKLILETASDSRSNSSDFDAPHSDSEHFRTYGVAAPGPCVLTWGYLLIDDGDHGFDATTMRSVYRVDLSKIDLGRIQVNPVSTEITQDYNVTLNAMPGMALGTVLDTRFDRQSGVAWFAHTLEWKSVTEAEGAVCAPKDKKCAVSTAAAGNALLFVNDRGIAHRLARALAHEASLCGAQRSGPK